MNAAASSWCTRRNFTLSAWRRSPSMMPLMPSPGMPNTVSTPHSASREIKASEVISATYLGYPNWPNRISAVRASAARLETPLEELQRLAEQTGHVHLGKSDLFGDLDLRVVAVEAQTDDLLLALGEPVHQHVE